MTGSRLARTACLLCVAFASYNGTWAHAQGARDFSKVGITTHKVSERFYVLDFGGTGSAVSILTGADGVLLVDAQFAPLAPRIAATIGTLTDRADARYVIDTHAHGDHVGGNEFFARAGATIIARDEVRDQLLRAMQAPDSHVSAAALPVITYEGRMTLHFDGEEVQLITVPAAHTDGDTLVYFPGLDVIVTGDLFRSVPYPLINLSGGGTLQGTIDALDRIIGLAGPATVIVSGHADPLSDRANVIVQRQLIVTVRDRVAALIAAGKSAQEVLAAHVTAGLDPRVPEDDITVNRFVSAVYADLTGNRPAPAVH